MDCELHNTHITCGGGAKCVQNFKREMLSESLGDMAINGTSIFKTISQRQSVRLWTAVIRLRMGSTCGHL